MPTQFLNSHGQRFKQKGISLLEGMISMLLIATLGLSLMVVISNTLSIQRFIITESWILMNLRNIATTDDTNMTRKNSQGETVSVSVTKEDVNINFVVSIDGVSKNITVTGKKLQVSDTNHVSGDGMLILSP